jgi:hypothetical protein
MHRIIIHPPNKAKQHRFHLFFIFQIQTPLNPKDIHRSKKEEEEALYQRQQCLPLKEA